MKKLTSILFMLLISFCFVLTGCGGAPLAMPENYDSPVSNGGFVVGAGNYVYFANAYKSYSSLTSASDNDGANVAQYSMKRMRLEENVDFEGNPMWLKLSKDEEGAYNYEHVLSKIAGFETSNMYVVNDYLYFTSPNIHKNNHNEQEFNLTSLFRIKLDGSGLKEILTTTASNAKFYLTENKTLVIYDNSKIQTINLKQNSTKVETLAEDATNVVFPKVQEQDIAWLYYTANRAEEDFFSGNIIKKVSLKNVEDSKEVYKVAGETVTIVGQDNGTLFYTISGGNKAGLYSNNFSSSSSAVRHRTLTTNITDETDLMYVKTVNSDYDCFVFIDNDNLYIQLMTETGDAQAEKITTETTTLHFYNGSYVYYSTPNGIYRYSVIENEHQQISNETEFETSAIDYDGRYVYYFVKAEGQETETKYLYRADTYNTDLVSTECIAELLENDIPEENEEE